MNKELFDPNSSMYALGYLMNSPTALLKDKYLLTPDDFQRSAHKIVFSAIYNLAINGAKKIQPQDIDIYIAQYGEQYKEFASSGGLKFAADLQELGANDEGQFQYHYNTLKKYTILRDLERSKISTKEFLDPNVDFLKESEQIERFNNLTAEQILDHVRLKILKVERKNVCKSNEYFQDVSTGLRDLVEGYKIAPDIGVEIEGEYFNFIINGARPGRMVFLSAPQAHGKTRTMIGNACRLSLPYISGDRIVVPPDLQRTLYIATEQSIEEIQTIVLAYVSGVNEAHIKKNQMNEEEAKRVEIAIRVIEEYKDNLYLDRYTSPGVESIRSLIVEKVIEKQVAAVFYDYIFVPTDASEARANHQFRSDQNLMRMSNVLKEIASVHSVFMVSGSQISNDWRGAKFRDQWYLRDAKSLADKIDVGCISTRLDDEELACVKSFIDKLGLETPNYVTDIYKNRDGEIEQCKIFSRFDFGTARRKDLFVTTPSYNLIENVGKVKYQKGDEISLLDFLTREENL